MEEPNSASSDPGTSHLDPALAQLIARAREAIAAGLPTEAIEREIAKRFAEQSAALMAALKAMQATGPNAKPALPPASSSPRPLGETWTMSGPVTWTSPAVEGTKSQVGRFELLGRIGAGGSGVVFKARDPQLGRLVALKVARAETLCSQEAKLRFTREARVLAALRHSNINPVYEAGEANGLPYIVQELCEGPTLAAWMRQQVDAKRPVPILIAARWALLTAKAVAQAHAVGVVHRDLKPGNVLLGITGTACFEARRRQQRRRRPAARALRATDHRFRHREALWLRGRRHGHRHHAGNGRVHGPRAGRRQNAKSGAAADVYSLGVILYELLTGRRPIEGTTEIDTLRRLAIDEPLPPTRTSPRRSARSRGDLPEVPRKGDGPPLSDRRPNELARISSGFSPAFPSSARPVGLIRRIGEGVSPATPGRPDRSGDDSW